MSIQPSRYTTLLLIWAIGIILIFGIYIKGSLNELTPIRNMIGSGEPSRHIISYQDKFNIIIDYEFARKGPLAILRIHESKEGTEIDYRAKPIQIYCDPKLELVDQQFNRYGLNNWGDGVFWIRVTEDEMGLTKSYLEFINTDHDYEPEVFIYQPEPANSRAMPIKTGAYLLNYSEELSRWEISKYRGGRTFWGIRHKVRNLILIVIMNLLLFSAAIYEKSNSKHSALKKILTIAVINIIIVTLTYLYTPALLYLMPRSICLLILNFYLLLTLVKLTKKSRSDSNPGINQGGEA